MATVKLKKIKKSYGLLEVLHGIDVDVKAGEFVVLVGPSGCGKSTLLRVIAGLETIASGDVIIDEKIVNSVQPKHRDIAMVFQNYALYPQMTVAQNMGFSLRMAKVEKPIIEQKVKEAANVLGLEELLGRYPRQLSGGQRQRVAMGRAIVRDPKVFLFDEPLSNLDAKLRVQMRTEIKELHQRLGTTIIYVTHDQVEAMSMADKIVVMRDGIVEQIGSPLELYDRPANMFVAGFIGSPMMNFLPAKIDEGQAVLEDKSAVTLPNRALKTAKDITLGLRPEDIIIGKSGIEGHVSVIEPMGSETQVVFQIGKTKVIATTRDRVDANPGDKVQFGIRPERLHAFDPKNGKALT